MTKVQKALGIAWICTDRINCGRVTIQPPCNCPDCKKGIHGTMVACPYCTVEVKRLK